MQVSFLLELVPGTTLFNAKLTSICPKLTVSAMNITFLVKSRPKHTPAAVESLRLKSSALTLN